MQLNPVEKRMARLCEDWIAFRESPGRRLLVWQAAENAQRLVQCFFETQKLELPYASGDLFLVFDAPFEDSIRYARAIKSQLLEKYQASAESLAAEGVTEPWDFAPDDWPDSATGVIHAMRHFGSRHRRHLQHLVMVLQPQASSDDDAFAAWLRRALDAGLPDPMRLAVVDITEHPRWPGLTTAADARIDVRPLALDGMQVAQETFAQETTTGPAGVYRNLMMGVAALMDKGSADQVKARAADALQFARQQRWADQEVVLRVMVGGALLKEGRHAEAINVYRVAREAADRALGQAHPAATKLTLQTLFGEAGAHLAAGDTLSAADCYDSASEAAWRDRNLLLALEAFRMGAFCLLRTQDTEGAIERLHFGMQVGEQLQPGTRGMTTLPLVAVDLLRALEPERVVELEQAKADAEHRQRQIGSSLEAAAVVSEGQSDSSATEAAAAERDAALAASHAGCEADVQAVLARAGEPWREQFERARSLMGTEWPMQLPLALTPAASPTMEGDAS